MKWSFIRRVLLFVGVAGLLAVAGVAVWRLSQRPTQPPLYSSGNLLVNPAFQEDRDGDRLPDGWQAGPAAELADWTITPEAGGFSLRLTGAASFARSAAMFVWPGKLYRLSLQALTDAPEPNRLQVIFLWEDKRREVIRRESSPWQEAPSQQWRLVKVAARAPSGAVGLSIKLRPAGDDPIYVDDLYLSEEGVRLEPFPNYAQAALAFTFDWESAMGGLIHSRSDDGYNPATAEERGLAMRQGTESLVTLLDRYAVRVTWFAAGYSLLPGNPTGETFSGDPIYDWASAEHGWRDDRWVTTPWFADDPHGTAQSHPAWYFGDLVPDLLASGHDIQSHTFGHLYGGYVSSEELRTDLLQWNSAAASVDVPPARTLAFPWGASLGMSDANYSILEELGYIAVTRTYHAPQGRSQYWIIPPDDLFHMRTVPGHTRLWAFPDHYFPGRAADLSWAKEVIERVLLEQGVTSLWAHTEEIVSQEQLDTWDELLAYATSLRAEGLWIAPLTEIAQFRNDLAFIDVRARLRGQKMQLAVRNRNDHTVVGLTLTLPAPVDSISLNDSLYSDFVLDQVRLPPLQRGQRIDLDVSLSEWEAFP
jgi:peptidoglycan/xylan/chitin deacetylase (PgdA/CDA1 family)